MKTPWATTPLAPQWKTRVPTSLQQSGRSWSGRIAEQLAAGVVAGVAAKAAEEAAEEAARAAGALSAALLRALKADSRHSRRQGKTRRGGEAAADAEAAEVA